MTFRIVAVVLCLGVARAAVLPAPAADPPTPPPRVPVSLPVQRQVTRAFLPEGNLVRQDETLLTTVVSLDPMYVYFNMDLGTLLRIRQAINEGKLKPPVKGQLPVGVALPGDNGYPRQGTVNFVNN